MDIRKLLLSLNHNQISKFMSNKVTNVKTTLPTEPLEHNDFFINIQNLLKESYELNKKFLEEEKKFFYCRPIQPVDIAAVLSGSLV